MNRVLLLLDDYSEMTFIQIVLMKLGFDVDTLQNPHTLSDRLISFRPQLLLLTEESKRYSTETVLNSARSQVSELKVILLKVSKGPGIDTLTPEIRRIGSPAQPKELIEACAQSCGLSALNLIEKFKSFKGQLQLTPEQEEAFGFLSESGSEKKEVSPQAVTERSKRFKEHLAKNGIKDVSNTLSSKDVHSMVKRDRVQDSSKSANAAVDIERQDFVKELFKKTKS